MRGLVLAGCLAVLPAGAPALGDGHGRGGGDGARGHGPRPGVAFAARGGGRGHGDGQGRGVGRSLGRGRGAGGGNGEAGDHGGAGRHAGGGGRRHHTETSAPTGGGGGSGQGGGRPAGSGAEHHGGGGHHSETHHRAHAAHHARAAQSSASNGAVGVAPSPAAGVGGGSVGAGQGATPVGGGPASPAVPQPVVPVPGGTVTPGGGAPTTPGAIGAPLPRLTPGLQNRLATGGGLGAPASALAAAAAGAIPAIVPGSGIGAFGPVARATAPPSLGSLSVAGERARNAAAASSLRPFAGDALAAVPRGVWIALAALGVLSVLLVGTTTTAAVASRRRGRALEQAAALGMVDSLTGLLMRGALEQRLAAEVGRARRHNRPLSLVFFDVRGLKAVNDLHGHGAGDRVLREVGALLVASSRDHDVCGRIGGDECVVVLPEDDGPGAEAFRNRVYAALPQARENVGLGEKWDLTSGVATFPEDGETPRELLDAADRRLYEDRGIRIDPPGSPGG